MQYQWNGSNYQPFINLGISSALALTSELTYQNKTEKNVLSSYQQGLVLGGGANSGKYSLELRAEFINEAYQFPDWLTNVFLDPKYISLLVGYRF